MIKTPLIACLATLLLVGSVMADEDCDDPISEWQSQEKLRQMMENKGWNVRRIKVDDGCYEVYGFDRLGNHFEAKFSPATLNIRSLEIEFESDGNDASDYLDRNYRPQGGNPPSANPGQYRQGKDNHSAVQHE